ncbi:MAG TPA: peptidoglycan DD-metalloendopeptidase family protein, partial [Flavisolibacter sp.]|nr:peptidoglycan DD-metalloendopeptidase family protein [Flavisolibacter sp.]
MTAKNFEERLQLYTGTFAPVVPVAPGDRLLPLDFTESNQELTADMLADTRLFTAYIDEQLVRAGARYGVGGYNEHRTIYSRSRVFDAPPGEEPRRLHLGLDIWGPADTPIYAPLEGTVHSFAFNDAFGDYGATLILQHTIDGFLFHTLYGHLSLKSIHEKKEEATFEKGQWIASFGVPEENGHWPPHLHFQVITDMQGRKGDYPGVCRFSERERYLQNCPDPELL